MTGWSPAEAGDAPEESGPRPGRRSRRSAPVGRDPLLYMTAREGLCSPNRDGEGAYHLVTVPPRQAQKRWQTLASFICLKFLQPPDI